MGVDIHQYNIIRFKDSTTVLQDGAQLTIRTERSDDGVEYEATDETYASSFIPELIPGRDSVMFAFMADGRGDAPFKIHPEPGIPEILLDPKWAEEKKLLTEGRFGDCWYYVTDLLAQLKKAAERIKWYMQVKAAKDPDYLKWGEVEEDEWQLKKIRKIIDDLTVSMKKNDDETAKKIDWEKTQICFNFDC